MYMEKSDKNQTKIFPVAQIPRRDCIEIEPFTVLKYKLSVFGLHQSFNIFLPVKKNYKLKKNKQNKTQKKNMKHKNTQNQRKCTYQNTPKESSNAYSIVLAFSCKPEFRITR